MTTTADLPTLPALVVGRVSHRRRAPITHSFRYRAYQWLVDLDQLPAVPWYLRPVATFRAADHLGRADDDQVRPAAIKPKVLRFLAGAGVDLSGGRVVMLAQARVLGHVFDPLSVFWCFGADGRLRCVVAEVHNTYGERHAYLLETDGTGHAQVDKRFYVSPFNDVSGRYALRFEVAPDAVRVTVSLAREDTVVFTARFEGEPTPATPRAIALIAVRLPGMPQRVSALIRLHGIRLWLRRLPVQRRPVHLRQEGIR